MVTHQQHLAQTNARRFPRLFTMLIYRGKARRIKASRLARHSSSIQRKGQVYFSRKECRSRSTPNDNINVSPIEDTAGKRKRQCVPADPCRP